MKIRHEGHYMTCARSQFPLRIANQGSTLHAFNGLTAEKIQIVISKKDPYFSYWALEHPISAHGRTPAINGVTYASPPGYELDRADILENITYAISQRPACGDDFFNWLFYHDRMAVLNPQRNRRDAPVCMDHLDAFMLEPDPIHLGVEAVVYVLFSEVTNLFV